MNRLTCATATLVCLLSCSALAFAKDGPQGESTTTETAPPDESPAEGAALGGDLFGNGPGGVQIGYFNIRTFLQARYTQNWAEKSTNPAVGNNGNLSVPSFADRENYLATKDDGWAVNRLLLRLGANPSPQYGFKSTIDFAALIDNQPRRAAKQAYGEVNPIVGRLEFTAGLFKIPFSTMELDPIAQYELASLGHIDDLIKDLGFAGRDAGAQVRISPLPKKKHLRILFGLFRGEAHDENASATGVVAGRLESNLAKIVTLGASVVGKPRSYSYSRPFRTSNRDKIPQEDITISNLFQENRAAGKAMSADIGLKLDKLHVRGEAMMGDRVDIDTRYGARTWWAAWGLVAYRIKVGAYQLMPAARFEWLDADRENDTGRRLRASVGLNFILNKGVRLLLDVSRTQVQPSSPLLDQPSPLPAPRFTDGIFIDNPYYDLSRTKAVLQLQMLM